MRTESKLWLNKRSKGGRIWDRLSRLKVTDIRYLFFGREINRGLLFKLLIYWVLVITAYIYLNPILKMLVKMVMSKDDMLDPAVEWIPREIYWGHLADAAQSLMYGKSVLISITVSAVVALFHVITCGMMGYSLARMNFPGKSVLLVMLVLAFIIPPQVTVLPLIIMYTKLGLQNHLISLILPSVFGFGIKGSLFVIIFRQFYMTQPVEMEEAAKIDGAGAFKFYWKIMFPLAKPSIFVVSIFSFIWTWNDTYYPNIFLSVTDNVPLALQMARMDEDLKTILDSEEMLLLLMEGIKMAASFLVILPPLIIFFLAQRYFVKSVERSGFID
ncbi:carbohydrate ABC transporter permease [Paenibacillus durus]|uniref:ABC transporter permease n=1 Tax=Paenibacillus durus ATCC 35681 TaxID=1333534 RepID=A0A0F7FBW8_PAEDU|nr:carbohydrate ABC transporter permease [Paenibacillus durus]AKG36233.1 ABC transporter permease [Paenibacillus durus ATCC 35681]